MDELTRALQISRHADAIIADSGNASKCLSNAHAIKGLAEAIDEAEHSKVRKMISIRTFESEPVGDGFQPIPDTVVSVVEVKEAPAPENKMGKKPANK